MNFWRGFHVDQKAQVSLVADQQVCSEIASQLGVVSVSLFEGQVTLNPMKVGINCQGSWKARWKDICVMSGVEIELSHQEDINVRLRWDQQQLLPNDDEIELDSEGMFFLAALLVEYFSIAMPDYPRDPALNADSPLPWAETASEATSEATLKTDKTQPFADLANLLNNNNNR